MSFNTDASASASCSKRQDDSAPAPWYKTIRKHLSTHPPGSTWSTSSERSLLEPYAYLASRPGKEIRSKLIDAFNFWLQVPESRLRRVRKVVDMLHTASLLMDDVEDNSDLRRGLPVAHKVYGTPQVLNTANYVYFLVFKEIEAMGQGEEGGGSAPVGESSAPSSPSSASSSVSKATQSERLLVEEMINLHRGQGLDLLWRDTLTCPTEEEYVEMVRNKTGGLLRIAGGLMMIWSPLYPDFPLSSVQTSSHLNTGSCCATPPELLPLLDLIGLLFQIRDDYMNLSAESYAQNKGFAEDLTEGKFSFPMIHGIRWSGGGSGSARLGGHSDRNSRGEAAQHVKADVMPMRADRSPDAPRIALDSPHLFDAPLPPLSMHCPSSSRCNDSDKQVAPNRQLLSILSSRPTDDHLKRYAVSYLRHVTGSFAYCRQVMRELYRVIVIEVERVEKNFAEMKSEEQREESKTKAASAGRNEQLRKILEALKAGWWEEEDGLEDVNHDDGIS